MYLDKEFSRWK